MVLLHFTFLDAHAVHDSGARCVERWEAGMLEEWPANQMLLFEMPWGTVFRQETGRFDYLYHGPYCRAVLGVFCRIRAKVGEEPLEKSGSRECANEMPHLRAPPLQLLRKHNTVDNEA
jgi:hypothetical protein